MSLRKRGGIWWVDIRAPNGERIRRTTETASKALAQAFHDRIKSELWRVSKLADKPQFLWNDAAVRWLKEQSHKATAGEDVTKLRWLDAHLGGKPLAFISRALIDGLTEAKLAQGVSNSTANRTLELVRAILRKCVDEWEWLERAPKIRMLKEPVRRIRFLRQEEAQRLIAALPEHLAAMASFTLSTGLRAANVTGLQWTQVDLVRRVAWIHPDQAKARRAIPVPLNTDAVLLLRQRLGKHSMYVFTYRVTGSRRSVRRRGTRRLRRSASRIFAGMICVTPGRVGTCRQERRCSHFRRWAAGRARRWCGAMRISPPIT